MSTVRADVIVESDEQPEDVFETESDDDFERILDIRDIAENHMDQPDPDESYLAILPGPADPHQNADMW